MSFIPIGVLIVIGLIIVFYFKTKNSDAKQQKIYSEFLGVEHQANFSRKKDPSPEDYLSVNIHTLPIREYPDDPAYARVTARRNNVLEAARLPMLRNVSQMNNREVKLKYGTANLDTIITYEENYNRFIHNLLEWSTALIALGDTADAAAVLETAINHHCDRSQAYTLLADIITERSELYSLREKAQTALCGSVAERTMAYIDKRLESSATAAGGG